MVQGMTQASGFYKVPQGDAAKVENHCFNVTQKRESGNEFVITSYLARLLNGSVS